MQNVIMKIMMINRKMQQLTDRSAWYRVVGTFSLGWLLCKNVKAGKVKSWTNNIDENE